MPKRSVEIVLLKPEQLSKLAKNLRVTRKDAVDIARQELETYAQVYVQAAQQRSPRREGWFAAGLDYTWDARQKAVKLTWTPTNRPRGLLEWLVLGTGIYGPRRRMIKPRRKRMLSWTVGNRRVWAKQVRGIKPSKFLLQAWRDTADLRKVLDKKLGGVLVKKLLGESGRPFIP